MPDELAEFMDHGQPSDAFFATFAMMPMVEGESLGIGDLLEIIKKP
jgi:hypothetical protein